MITVARTGSALLIAINNINMVCEIALSSNFDEGYTQQDIPSTTQRYILRPSTNNSMIKCSI